jgi:hypothetical protein
MLAGWLRPMKVLDSGTSGRPSSWLLSLKPWLPVTTTSQRSCSGACAVAATSLPTAVSSLASVPAYCARGQPEVERRVLGGAVLREHRGVVCCRSAARPAWSRSRWRPRRPSSRPARRGSRCRGRWPAAAPGREDATAAPCDPWSFLPLSHLVQRGAAHHLPRRLRQHLVAAGPAAGEQRGPAGRVQRGLLRGRAGHAAAVGQAHFQLREVGQACRPRCRPARRRRSRRRGR